MFARCKPFSRVPFGKHCSSLRCLSTSTRGTKPPGMDWLIIAGAGFCSMAIFAGATKSPPHQNQGGLAWRKELSLQNNGEKTNTIKHKTQLSQNSNRKPKKKVPPMMKMAGWVNEQIGPYGVTPVTDFSSNSWSSGDALVALVDSLSPGICPLNRAPASGFRRIQYAMDVAQESLNIPPNITAETVYNPQKQITLLGYISLIRERELMGNTHEPIDRLCRVIPGVYLGPLCHAMQPQKLREEGITHVLNLSHLMYREQVRDDWFHYRHEAVDDELYQDLSSYFDSSTAFINDARKSGGVLVHCLGGVSRSVTIVCAYLMAEYSMSAKNAFKLVQSARKGVDPNPAFWKQLEEYEQHLKHSRAST